MSKILLIQPSFEPGLTVPNLNSTMPLGLIYIGTVLKHNGHQIKIFDRNLNPSDQELLNLIRKNYDFIGISSYTSRMLYDAIKVSKMAKENSNSIVVWGSYHATSVPENTLKNEYVDYIVRGEGEETFLNMVNLHEKGKSFSNLNGVNLNPAAPAIDMDKLPFPDYDLVEVKKYPNFYISTSRGCPYRCSFCYNSYGPNCMQPYKEFSFNKSVELIRNLSSKYKKRTFTIVDDNFPSNRERLKLMSREMRNMDIKFDICCRANYCDMETLSYLKKAGCWQIQIGVESGSQRVLNFLKKGTTVKMNADAINNCHKIGIMTHASFMIGIPTETIEELNETLRFVKNNKPDLGGAGIFQPFPRTKLWDYCMERGIIKEPKTTEEWAGLYPTGYNKVNMKVSDIPNETLMQYHHNLNKMINKGRNLKKIFLYLKSRRMPDYRRVISILKPRI
ncbi:MAG: radical SAM protein [Nanoarchaeota archaeon]|nr:radical SAM protein [Nanoarchaeota archaeon]